MNKLIAAECLVVRPRQGERSTPQMQVRGEPCPFGEPVIWTTVGAISSVAGRPKKGNKNATSNCNLAVTALEALASLS